MEAKTVSELVVDWAAYKQWYTQNVRSGVWLMHEPNETEVHEKIKIVNTYYYRVTQGANTAHIPVRFVKKA